MSKTSRKPSGLKYHQKKKILKIIFLGLALLLVLFFTIINFLTIKKIIIEPDLISCAGKKQLLGQLNLQGKNIFLVNLRAIEAKLKGPFPCIAEIRFERFFPDQIKVIISERKPAAIIITTVEASSSARLNDENFVVNIASASGSFVTDKEGFIFSNNIGGLNLPTIGFDGELKVGVQMEKKDLLATLTVLSKLREMSLNPLSSRILDGRLYISADPKIVFSLRKDYEKQLVSLQLILHKAKIETKKVTIIDLGFDKPVIIYGQR